MQAFLRDLGEIPCCLQRNTFDRDGVVNRLRFIDIDCFVINCTRSVLTLDQFYETTGEEKGESVKWSCTIYTLYIYLNRTIGLMQGISLSVFLGS